MANELKIRIIKDSKGNKLSLDKITIEAAESLKIFIDSFTTLAKLYDDADDFKLSLTEGSVEGNLLSPTNSTQFNQDIKDVINGTLNDTAKIKPFKAIQDKIKKNGLDYEVFWKINGKTQDLTQVFKGSNFPYKRNRDECEFETVFLQGRLFEAGGKTITNIHIEDNKGMEHKIGCSEDEVVVINKYIYKTVYLSAIKSTKSEKKPSLRLIDYYQSKEEQTELQQIYLSILESHDLERFDVIHDQLNKLLDDNKISLVKYLLNIFNNEYTDRGIIRTTLMTLKTFIKSKSLKDLMIPYESLSVRLRAGSLNNRI